MSDAKTFVPQFHLKANQEDCSSLPSRLFFNGQEVKNILRVEIVSILDRDEPKSTRLIIDLFGEVVAVE